MTRRALSALLFAAGAGAAKKPEAVVKHLEDSNDGGLVQARFELTPAHEEAVRGVEGVEFYCQWSRYEAAIYKGARFTWGEVAPEVVKALKGVRR